MASGRSAVAQKTRKAREWDAKMARENANIRDSAPDVSLRPRTKQQEREDTQKLALECYKLIVAKYCARG